jgi:hypothetical protein
MSERINRGSDSPPVRVLQAAMQATRTVKGKRVEQWPNLMVEVKLTVDGIEVPFMDTLRQMIDNENRAVEKRAEALALRALSEVGLDRAVAAIRQANFKLAQVMGKIVSAIPDDVKE